MLEGSYYSFIKGQCSMTFCVFVEDAEPLYLLHKWINSYGFYMSSKNV